MDWYTGVGRTVHSCTTKWTFDKDIAAARSVEGITSHVDDYLACATRDCACEEGTSSFLGKVGLR